MCLAIFVVAIVARAGWGTYRLVRAPDPCQLEFPDEQQYWLMASNLWQGNGLTDEFGFHATRMPLFPGLLAPLTGIDNGVVVAKVAHWFIGAAAAVLTALLASSLIERRAVAWLAGLMVALDPFLVFSSSLLLTETLFIVASLGLWWAAAPLVTTPVASLLAKRGKRGVAQPAGDLKSTDAPWHRWLTIGIIAAATVYAREAGLVLVALLLVFILEGFKPRRAALAGAAMVVAIVTLTLLPWAVRNHEVTGAWCWTTTRAGVSLYDGVRPGADGASDLADIQQASDVADLDEVAWNRHFVTESIRLIKADPWRIAKLAGRKLSRTWNPLPNVETYQSAFVRVVSAAWMVPTLAFALAGAMIMSKRQEGGGWRLVLFLLLPAVQVSTLHSLFVGSVRYRLGAMPMLEIGIASGRCRCSKSWPPSPS